MYRKEVVHLEPSEKRKTIIKVAKLYYYGNMTQNEIADMMGISRPKVSRLLTAAQQYNIVQIKINDPAFSNEEAANTLRRHFGLKAVTVVSPGQSLEEAKDNIGKAASDFLNDHLSDQLKIGISWGTTLNSFVHRYQCSRAVPGAIVAQLVGGTYSQTMHMDGRDLAKNLAKKLKCRYSVLETPMIVHNPELKKLLMEEPETIEHFKLLKNLDIAFVGVGSANYKESVIYKAKYLDEPQAKQLYSMGLCDICGHQIDSTGQEPETSLSDRLIGISLKDLAAIPMVVGLCAGNMKTKPILSAVRGGYLDALIIDEIAAISLMEAENLE